MACNQKGKNMTQQIDILPPELTAITVYQGKPVTEIISYVEKSAKEEVAQYDIKTANGRKAIASVAYKVAKSKTFLDDLGKDMVEDWKTAAKKVDADRKLIRDSLDAIKDDVRKPLTEWENAEKERIAIREGRIKEIQELRQYNYESVAAIDGAIAQIVAAADFDWMEFLEQAQDASTVSKTMLEAKKAELLKAEAERAELERLRLEAAAREQAEREERIAREAAKAATEAAEAAAKKAADEAAAVARANEEKAERARLEAVAQAEKAKRDAELAVQREREKVEAEKKAAEAAEQKRAADVEHKKAINNAALAAFVETGLDAETAKITVQAIAAGKIPHVKISY